MRAGSQFVTLTRNPDIVHTYHPFTRITGHVRSSKGFACPMVLAQCIYSLCMSFGRRRGKMLTGERGAAVDNMMNWWVERETDEVATPCLRGSIRPILCCLACLLQCITRSLGAGWLRWISILLTRSLTYGCARRMHTRTKVTTWQSKWKGKDGFTGNMELQIRTLYHLANYLSSHTHRVVSRTCSSSPLYPQTNQSSPHLASR